MADDKVEIELEIDKASQDLLAKQFTDVTDKGFSEAFKRMASAKNTAAVDKVFKHLYGQTAEGQAEAAAASREKMMGYAKSGVGVATAVGQGSVTGVLSSMGPHGAIVAGAINAVQAFGDTVLKFVGAANPAVVEQLNLAFEDINGVIGRFLVPVIERVTPWIRMFGDFLASILPNAQELDKALAPMNDALQTLKEAINPLIPLIKDDLLTQLKAFALVLKGTVELWKLMSAEAWVAKLTGGKTDNFDSSIGAAYRGPASYQGVGEAGRGLHLAGFGYQGGTAMDRAAAAGEDSASSLKSILTILEYVDGSGLLGFSNRVTALLPGNQ